MGSAMGLGSFCGMAAAPVFASLAMRFSLRRIMLVGAVFGGITMFMMGRFTNLGLFTINFCLLWVAGQACGGVIANALMSNWFIKHRGKAFGIVNFGMSFSGAVLPFVALLLIKLFSVQTATAMLGGFSLLVLVPGIWFFVRDTPESMGLKPDGEEEEISAEPGPERRESDAAEPDEAPGIRELLRSPLVYQVGISFAFGIMAAAGVVGQLKPRFSDLGFSDFTAMAFMCATAFFTATGKFVWGWICDRVPPLRVARILFLYSIGAFLLAFLPPNIFTVSVFSVLCGLGMGGTWTVLPAVVVDVFGRKYFMAVYRVISLFIFFKSFGYIVMGQAHQMTGNYDAAFIIFCVLFGVAFLITPREGSKYVKR